MWVNQGCHLLHSESVRHLYYCFRPVARLLFQAGRSSAVSGRSSCVVSGWSLACCFRPVTCLLFQAGRSFDPHFVFTWPTARICMTEPDEASQYIEAQVRADKWRNYACLSVALLHPDLAPLLTHQNRHSHPDIYMYWSCIVHNDVSPVIVTQTLYRRWLWRKLSVLRHAHAAIHNIMKQVH